MPVCQYIACSITLLSVYKYESYVICAPYNVYAAVCIYKTKYIGASTDNSTCAPVCHKSMCQLGMTVAHLQ